MVIMVIAAWLKRKLRSWLDGSTDELDCWVKYAGQRRMARFRITGTVGTSLCGVPLEDDRQIMIILPQMAVDQKAYWAAWKRRNPRARLEWVDEEAKESV